ncbi:MAG: hypothetical protein AAF363_14260 [Bacteroidota bacterium]
MNKITELVTSNYKYLSIVILIMIGFVIALSTYFSWVSADAAYYLSVARDIASGYIPYSDINMHYTPLMMYINSLIYFVFKSPNYLFFLLTQFLIIGLASILFFKLLIDCFSIKRNSAFFIVTLCALSILSSDGTYIVLEVYSFLFVIIGGLFFFRKDYLWAGFLIGFSFFIKQYSVLNYMPFYFLLFFYKSKREISWTPIILFSLGGLICLGLFLLIFLGIYEIPFEQLLSQLSGTEYSTWASSNTSSIFSYFIGVKNLLLLLLPILLFLLFFGETKSYYIIFLLIGILVNILPTFVKSYQHYLINTYPYVFILLGIVLDNALGKTKQMKLAYFAIALILFSTFVARIVKHKHKNYDQELISSKVKKVIPKGSEIYMHGEIRYLYILNNYRNPALEKVGYSYMAKDLQENFPKASLSNKLTGEITDIIPLNNKDSIYIYNKNF